VLLALPLMFVLAQAAHGWGLCVLLPPWLLASTAVLTLASAGVSGLVALGSLRSMDMAVLLRH
jgi:hypothetical protein